MAKKPTPVATEDETQRLYQQHFLARYLKVLAVLDNGAIEITVRPGHLLRVIHAAPDDGPRITRFVIGPNAPAGKVRG